MAILASIQDYLAAVYPDLPWLVLFASIWGVQWLLRRYAPAVWQLVFSWIPDDTNALLANAIQALPSVVIGAAIPALASHGDVKQAALGAVCGLFAPIWHHVLKAAPGSYTGALGAAKSPSGVPSGASP